VSSSPTHPSGTPGAACLLALAAVLISSVPALAQSAQSATPREDGTLQPTTAQRPGGPVQPSRSVTPGPSLDDTETAPDQPPIVPAGDPSLDPDDPLFQDASQPRPGQRAVVQDGDLAQPDEGSLTRDGVIDVGEPLPIEDGLDPTQFDTRADEDLALFENRPAAPDPLLFQIEDIDPLNTDRRTRRLFEREPYDPVGIRIGSFIYFPETEVNGLATSNLFRRSDAISDVAAEISTDSRLVSNWSRHAVELRGTSLTSFHNDFPDEDNRAWAIEGRGRLDIARRTNLQGLLSHDVRQEGRGAIDASTTGDRADVTTDQAELAFNHRFNRLSLQIRGSIADNTYEIADDPLSPTTGPNDRDTTVSEQAARATWEFKPTFAAFAEVEINQRRYDVAAVSDGFSRDSDGERTRIGIDFGSTGEILRGEVSIGYGVQNPDAAALSDVEGFLIDANVAWRLSDPTSILFTARTDLYDTNTANSAGVVARSFGVEARHAFQRYLVASAGLTYTTQDYDGVDIDETELRTALGLEYFVNREWILFGRYEHFDFRSNQTDGDWKSDDVRLGVRWRR
jgi:hypothetical protein